MKCHPEICDPRLLHQFFIKFLCDLFFLDQIQVNDIFTDRLSLLHIVSVRGLSSSLINFVVHFALNPVVIDDQKIIYHAVCKIADSFFVQKTADHFCLILGHLVFHQIRILIQIIKYGSVHGDDRKFQINPRKRFPHSRRCPVGRYGKVCPGCDQAVQLHFTVCRHLVFPVQDRIINAGNKKDIVPSASRQMC